MNAVVFGANGGIGSELVRQLSASKEFDAVFAVSRAGQAPSTGLQLVIPEYTDEALSQAAEQISGAGPIYLCICAIGVLSDVDGLRPERSLTQQSRDAFEQVFEANVVVPALIAKHIVPVMCRDERAVFAALSARVGSIADNHLGGWHAYRASKAALNMLIKNYAIEQSRKNAEFVAVGLHPGTVDTALSKPFQKNVAPEKLFTPVFSAQRMLDVIRKLDASQSGQVFDWAGERIPE